MNLERGYYWIRGKEGSWKIGLVEVENEEKMLILLGDPQPKRLSEIREKEIQTVRILNPEAVKKARKRKEKGKYGFRKPMKKIRPLYFVVQPERHAEQIRYVAQDELSSAAQEALRISKLSPDSTLYVVEAKPIGKVRDGNMEQM